MNRITTIVAAGLALAAALPALPAQALNARSFVSGHGSDANGCGLASPRRHIAKGGLTPPILACATTRLPASHASDVRYGRAFMSPRLVVVLPRPARQHQHGDAAHADEGKTKQQSDGEHAAFVFNQ